MSMGWMQHVATIPAEPPFTNGFTARHAAEVPPAAFASAAAAMLPRAPEPRPPPPLGPPSRIEQPHRAEDIPTGGGEAAARGFSGGGGGGGGSGGFL